MNPLERLTQLFTQFPGIGSRQAQRFVYFLLNKDKTYINELSRLVSEINDHVKQCGHCFRYMLSNNASPLCGVCADTGTDKTTMMIVAKDVDLESVRKSGAYAGRYFVLGGTVPILEKEPAKKIREDRLVAEVKRAVKEDGLKEIIFALSANPEGENTTTYVKALIEPISNGAKLTVLGRGLSTGTELEYSDGDTLKNALKHRE